MGSDLGRIKPLAAAIGTVFTATLTPLTAAAADNPFGYSQLTAGYLVADHEGGGKAEGKCGEGKCGVKRMDTNGDGKVSKEEFMKMEEAKFTAMDTDNDGTIDAAEMKKMMEGKCGEGKCGNKK